MSDLSTLTGQLTLLDAQRAELNRLLGEIQAATATKDAATAEHARIQAELSIAQGVMDLANQTFGNLKNQEVTVVSNYTSLLDQVITTLNTLYPRG